jgi:hypothetical protein
MLLISKFPFRTSLRVRMNSFFTFDRTGSVSNGWNNVGYMLEMGISLKSSIRKEMMCRWFQVDVDSRKSGNARALAR